MSFSRKVQEQGLTATDVATALTKRVPFPVRRSPDPVPATVQAKERAEGAQQRRVIFQRPGAATPTAVAPTPTVTAETLDASESLASAVPAARPVFNRSTPAQASPAPVAPSSTIETPSSPVAAAPSTVAASTGGANAARSVFRRAPAHHQRVDHEQVRDDRYKRHRALRDKMNAISVPRTLEALDGRQKEKGKWKVDGTNIILKGQAWQNTLTQKKGFGSVGLVMDLLHFEQDTDAIRWLISKFGEEFGDDVRAEAGDLTSEKSEKKDFAPPENDPSKIEDVRRYLVRERGLPASLIGRQIDDGKIYSDPKSNCVFISPAAAEIRSTWGTKFNGCCTGSQTDISGFRVMHQPNVSESTISLVEAAIDALSYNALFPGRFTMSTNGSGRFMLQFKVAREAIDNGFKIKAAFDADWAGDYAAQKLFNAFYVRTALSHQLKVEPEVVDEWMLNEQIKFSIDASPHHAFFNEGWSASKGVNASETIVLDGERELVWYDTQRQSAPMIRVSIERDLHPELRRGQKDFVVTEKAYTYVTEKLGLMRDRPMFTKDWNDEMKRLGSAFTQDYERCAERGFNHGLAVLPEYLETLRAGSYTAQIALLGPVLETLSPEELARLKAAENQNPGRIPPAPLAPALKEEEALMEVATGPVSSPSTPQAADSSASAGRFRRFAR